MTRGKPRRYRARAGERCSFCKQRLQVDQWVFRGLTREPYHPACRSISRRQPRTIPPPVYDSPVPRLSTDEFCAGCGVLVTKHLCHRSGVPFHRECLV